MFALAAFAVFMFELIFTPDVEFSLVVLGLALISLHLLFPKAWSQIQARL